MRSRPATRRSASGPPKLKCHNAGRRTIWFHGGKPWISTTAGPWPPTRKLIVASAFTTCELRKSAGKGVGAARADRAPSARLAARPAATRRKNLDETVADILG